MICDAEDVALPCRTTKRIYDAAIGPKQMWVVPGAFHTAALGYEPAEFRRRRMEFFATYSAHQPLVDDGGDGCPLPPHTRIGKLLGGRARVFSHPPPPPGGVEHA